jgi:hypothetical protein
MKLFLIIFGLFASIACFGQHKLHGVIKDSNGRAMAGLRIFVNGHAASQSGHASPWAVTTANGDFVVDLDPGDSVLTIDPESLYHFRAFIKIIDNGLKPDNVTFTVDTEDVCCTSAAGVPFPKPLSLPKPRYPPAALATRTTGEIIVTVHIAADGEVISAKAMSGSPLLKVTAELAAKTAIFELGNVDEREARLFYVFIDDDEKLKEGVTVYTNPYRIEIVAPRQEIFY